MRAVDDSGEASAIAEQARDDRRPRGRAPARPGTGTAAPRATLVKLTGLKLRFHSSERASATATLRARGKTIARGSAKARRRSAIRLRLTSAGRAMLRRGPQSSGPR